MARTLMRVAIDSVAPGGDGVAHVEVGGQMRAVFVSRTAPGDVLQADVDFSKRPARGSLAKMIVGGPDRVEPPCRWSDRCGGCDFMHLSAPLQERIHVEHVRASLPPAWRDIEIASHTPVAPLGYRTRARVHIRARHARLEAGMNEARSHDPVEVENCAVLDPGLEAARQGLASLFEGCIGGGEVQMAFGTGRRAVLDVKWDGSLPNTFFERAAKSVETGALAGLRLTLRGAKRPAVIGDPVPWMQGADGEPLQLAPGGFAQPSEDGNMALARYVAGIALASPGEARAARDDVAPARVDGRVSGLGGGSCVELYAGAGNLTVLVARGGKHWIAVERDGAACEAARANLSRRGLDARVIEADADDYEFASATRLVVLDPPRTGARRVAERLAQSRVQRVVYVSCDPPTLGRDLRILASAYQPESVAVFHLFPQTSHVETVVALDRIRGNTKCSSPK